MSPVWKKKQNKRKKEINRNEAESASHSQTASLLLVLFLGSLFETEMKSSPAADSWLTFIRIQEAPSSSPQISCSIGGKKGNQSHIHLCFVLIIHKT